MASPAPPSPATLVFKTAERKLHIHLLPFMFALVTLSFIDRTNLAFASLQMNPELGFSSTTYGWGSGVFFLGYAAFQIPSNLFLTRVGPPRWLASITLLWGVCASGFALIRNAWQFLLLRFLLGLFESGAMPGMWYYLSLFYPPSHLTLPYSVVETGITVSQILGAPLAAGLLSLDGTAGLRGWQWVFLAEGLPAMLLAVALAVALPAGLQQAAFLSAQERTALQRGIEQEAQDSCGRSSDGGGDADRGGGGGIGTEYSSPGVSSVRSGENEGSRLLHGIRSMSGEMEEAEQLLQGNPGGSSSRAGMPAAVGSSCGGNCTGLWQQVKTVARDPVVLYAGAWRVLHDVPGYGVLFWTPMLVKVLTAGSSSDNDGAAASSFTCSAPAAHDSSSSGGATPAGTGLSVVLLTAIPSACASLFHLINARHSQQSDERRLHIVLPWAMAAAALLLLPLAVAHQTSSWAFVLLVLAHVGINGANGCQTSWVASLLAGPHRAVGLAMYNCIGNLGGAVGPVVVGVLCDALGGYGVSMLVMGGCLAGAAAMVLCFKPHAMRRRWPAAS